MLTRSIFLILLVSSAGLFGCDENDDTSTTAIQLTPETSTLLEPNDTLQFQADRKLTWTVSGGTITDNGLYIAPNGAGIFEVSAFNSKDTATRTVIVTPHAELFKSMKKGGYVLYFRHMNAASGSDKFNSSADWWKSCDSTVARQLSPLGYTQAAETGRAFKNLELPIGKMWSSEFCRCIKSAETMDLKLPIETSQALTYYVYVEADRFKNTIKLAEAQSISDKNIVLMAHSFTTGESDAPNLQMGDAAVYKQLTGNKVEFVKIVTIADWTALKGR